jgi:hypothetical protein
MNPGFANVFAATPPARPHCVRPQRLPDKPDSLLHQAIPLVDQTSIRDPSIRVLSWGRRKNSAPSLLSLDVAMNRFLRHAGIVGSPAFVSSIFDKKYEASSIAINPSVLAGSSKRNTWGTSGGSMYPKRAVTWMIPS